MTKDEYTVRDADETDFEKIAEFLTRCDFGPKKPDWLRWKYLENPHGQARIFVVENSLEEINGLLAYMTNICSDSDSGPLRIMQTVDGIVDPDARGKGVYLKLLQNSMKTIDTPVIGFPNKAAENAHIKCGWRVLAPEERWYFPVMIGELGLNTWAGLAGPLINLMSRVYASIWLGSGRGNVEMTKVERFRRDFAIQTVDTCGIRSADFLNWRFIDNPMREYQTYEFLDGGDTIGYCVYGLDGASAEIFDFVVSRRQRVCLHQLVEHCRKKKITHLLFRGTGLRLGRFGFVKGKSIGNYISYDLPRGSYSFTLCDSDW